MTFVSDSKDGRISDEMTKRSAASKFTLQDQQLSAQAAMRMLSIKNDETEHLLEDRLRPDDGLRTSMTFRESPNNGQSLKDLYEEKFAQYRLLKQ